MLNCTWTDEELEKELPARIKRSIAKHHVKFYTLNGDAIGQKLGLGTRINMVMQAAFFALAKIIPIDDAVKYLKDSIVKSYGKKGQKVVDMNNGAVDAGIKEFHEVNYPASWADAKDEVVEGRPATKYFTEVAKPMLEQVGDDLPVSAFAGREDGTMPSGTAKFEKAWTRRSPPFLPGMLKNVSAACSAPSFARTQPSVRSSRLTKNSKLLRLASRRLLKLNPANSIMFPSSLTSSTASNAVPA